MTQPEEPAGANLNVTIAHAADGLELVVSSPREDDDGLTLELSGKAQLALGVSVDQLRAFKDIVEEVDVERTSVIADALGSLYKTGAVNQWELFGGRRD